MFFCCPPPGWLWRVTGRSAIRTIGDVIGHDITSIEVISIEVISIEVISIEVISIEVISIEVISIEVISIEVTSIEVISIEVISIEVISRRDKKSMGLSRMKLKEGEAQSSPLPLISQVSLAISQDRQISRSSSRLRAAVASTLAFTRFPARNMAAAT